MLLCSQWLPSCTKILLTVALNYSIQKTYGTTYAMQIKYKYIYIYEKLQFNSLVWGSLRLAPTRGMNRTLGGEHEQAMHCSIELLCSQSFTSEVSDQSTQAIHGI